MAIDGLRIRFFTSVVFVLVMLAGIMAGKYTFILLFGLILGFCLWEFLAAGVEGHDPSQWWLRRFGLVFGLVPYLAATAFQLGWMDIQQLEILALLLLPTLFLVFLIELFQNGPHPFRYIGTVFTGLLYIGMPFVLLSLAAFQPNGLYRMDLVLGIVLLTWTNDTGAYLVGSRLGKTPFFPRISPKKTWEGIIGAGLLCLGIAVALGFVLPGVPTGHWLVLSMLVFLFGSLGDLVESMFKRSRQIKDTGSLLPGHGGMLDRFDGFIFHLPFTAGYALLWVYG